ncbi:UNVERIFIED_CONTAM: hypothetical protein GTU68_052148 [Idotea baltica]|nr:hypothetical protein [Idotea baltica]
MTGLNSAALYTVQALGNLYLIIVLLRFVLQLVYANGNNPLSLFIIRATQPLLGPMRKVIPSISNFDGASLLLAIIVQMVLMALILKLFGINPNNILQLFIWSIVGVTALLLKIFFFSLIIEVILSWVAQGSSHPAVELVNQITSPLLNPIRRILPGMGGLDLSPIVAFLILNLLDTFVIRNLAITTHMLRGLSIAIS